MKKNICICFFFTRSSYRPFHLLLVDPFEHSNLAANNVLLSENLICKVADFGITQEGISVDRDYDRIIIRFCMIIKSVYY